MVYATVRRVAHSCYHTTAKCYRTMSGKYLLLTNAVVGMTLFTAGDVIEQKLIDKRKHLDIRRTVSMGSFGIIYGVVCHSWYWYMSRHAYLSVRPNTQALLYMFLLCPIENCIFFAYTGRMEGQNKQEIKKEISQKLLPTYMVDFTLYYPFMYMNARFVPFHMRATLENFYGFGYSIFLSYMKHHDINIPALTLPSDHHDINIPALPLPSDIELIQQKNEGAEY